MSERRVIYRVLVEKPEGKRQLGRPSLRCEYNNKMDLQEVEGDIDMIDESQDRDRRREI